MTPKNDDQIVIAAHGPAAVFVLHAGWMLGCALAVFILMPTDPVTPRRGGRGSLLAQHAAIYMSPRVSAPAMGFVCYTIIYVALLTLLPALVTAGWGGFVGVGMPLISIVISLTLGVWLLSRITAVRMVQAGFAVAIVAATGLWAVWGQGAGEAMFALLLAAALGIVQGASFASIPQLNATADDRARAAGAIAQLGNLGTTTGTPLLALIVTRFGPMGLALFVVGFAGAGILIHSVQARRRLIG